MMQPSSNGLTVFVLIAATMTGCHNPLSTHGRAKTLYLDPVAIARGLGRTELIQQQTEAAREQLNAQLAKITLDLNTELEQKRADLGAKPDEDALQQFDVLAANANQRLQQTQLLAQQKFASYRQLLLNDFRAELQSFATPIARQRGASGIALIDSSILWFDPSADITDEVIAEMRAYAGTLPQPAIIDTSGESAPDNDYREEVRKLNQLVDDIEEENSG
jgi:Skp family chaperone for outer membrane proteins